MATRRLAGDLQRVAPDTERTSADDATVMPGDPAFPDVYRAYMAGMQDMLQYMVTKVPGQMKSALLRHPAPPLPAWLDTWGEQARAAYVITRGSYSDYHIEGVYEKREYAEAVCEHLNSRDNGAGDEAEIETWELNVAVEPLKRGMHHFHVQMARDGTIMTATQDEDGYARLTGNTFQVIDGQRFRSGVLGPAVGGYLYLNAQLWADDRDHAIKIVNERRLILIAENQWRVA